ncbi:MAG: hypothetical protein IJ816_00540 [Alloprevotella sp.]|nr:hypothetical protein [Alloprevotella sp.]
METNLPPYVADFVEALADFCERCLLESNYDSEYSNEAIRILDARNHLFRKQTASATDEEHDIYMLRDLLRIDESTLDFRVNRQRILSIARNYFY